MQLQEQSKNEKTCTVCGASNDPTYKFCRVPECHGSLVRQKADTSYLHKNKARVKPSVHFKDIVTQNTNNLCVTCGDPDFVNLNSFSSTCQTLQNMGVRAELRDTMEKKGSGFSLRLMEPYI